MLEEGSSRPASTLNGEPAPPNLCSTRIVGVHVHKFPADANPGTATDMYVVGVFGEKNGVSSPAITDVLLQSKRMRAIPRLEQHVGDPRAGYPVFFSQPPPHPQNRKNPHLNSTHQI